MYTHESNSFGNASEMEIVTLIPKKLGGGARPILVSSVPADAQGTSEHAVPFYAKAVVEFIEDEADTLSEKEVTCLALFTGDPRALVLSATARLRPWRPNWDYLLSNADRSILLAFEDVLFVSVNAKGEPSDAKWTNPDFDLLWSAVSDKVRQRGYSAFCILPPSSENGYFKWHGPNESFECEVPESEWMIPRVMVAAHDRGFDRSLVDPACS
jgi:hypothetical protein